jgi:hypothetical protein
LQRARHSASWARPPVLFALVIFEIVSHFILELAWTGSSYLWQAHVITTSYWFRWGSYCLSEPALNFDHPDVARITDVSYHLVLIFTLHHIHDELYLAQCLDVFLFFKCCCIRAWVIF